MWRQLPRELPLLLDGAGLQRQVELQQCSPCWRDAATAACEQQQMGARFSGTCLMSIRGRLDSRCTAVGGCSRGKPSCSAGLCPRAALSCSIPRHGGQSTEPPGKAVPARTAETWSTAFQPPWCLSVTQPWLCQKDGLSTNKDNSVAQRDGERKSYVCKAKRSIACGAPKSRTGRGRAWSFLAES